MNRLPHTPLDLVDITCPPDHEIGRHRTTSGEQPSYALVCHAAAIVPQSKELVTCAYCDIPAAQALAGATTSIDKAREVLDAMPGRVRAHLEDLAEQLLVAQARDEE